MDGVKHIFKDETLDFIVNKAIEYKLGARGLRSIVETIMVDAMFEIPSKSIKKFEVTPEYAAAKLEAAGFDTIASTQNNI
jgi:ATP-dependent Clp protease ATP-binding subunit ClpX